MKEKKQEKSCTVIGKIDPSLLRYMQERRDLERLQKIENQAREFKKRRRYERLKRLQKEVERIIQTSTSPEVQAKAKEVLAEIKGEWSFGEQKAYQPFAEFFS